jgi:hypothetical protein
MGSEGMGSEEMRIQDMESERMGNDGYLQTWWIGDGEKKKRREN